jgi:DNA polymerase III sliding clamp (beta) subunit (PCNA family)
MLINPTKLQAVALALSTQETRYLGGVLVETYKDGSCGLAATDGHRLHTIDTKNEEVISQFILANADIKKAISLVKMAQKELTRSLRHLVQISIKCEGGQLNIRIVLSDDDGKEFGAFTSKEIDGNFPEWRRVVPSDTSQGCGVMSFNPDYLADFGAAAGLLNVNKVTSVRLTSSGPDAPILVTIAGCSEFMGVLVPMRF